MRKLFLSSLIVASAITLISCAGGIDKKRTATTAEESNLGTDIAEADSSESLSLDSINTYSPYDPAHGDCSGNNSTQIYFSNAGESHSAFMARCVAFCDQNYNICKGFSTEIVTATTRNFTCFFKTQDCAIAPYGRMQNGYLFYSKAYSFSAGRYTLKSLSGGGYLDGRNPGMSDPVLTHRDPTGDKYLQWDISTVDGHYSIRSVSSGGYLDGRNPGMSDPVLTSRSPNGDNYLLWDIIRTNTGTYAIRSVSGGGFLDGRNDQFVNPLLTYRDIRDSFFQWNLLPVPTTATPVPTPIPTVAPAGAPNRVPTPVPTPLPTKAAGVSVPRAMDNIGNAQRACGMFSENDAKTLCDATFPNQSTKTCALNFIGNAQRSLGMTTDWRYNSYINQLGSIMGSIDANGCSGQGINDLGTVYNNISPYTPESFAKMIPLKMQGAGGPPYIKVEGAATQGSPLVLFDTGSTVMSLPYNNVNSSQVTVLQRDVKDQFGHAADLVQGQIQIASADGSTKYTINNFVFYRIKPGDGWAIFGAWPVYHRQGSECMTGFFMALDYAPYGNAGFSLISDSDHYPSMKLPFTLYLKVGLNSIPSDTLWHQYPDDPYQCSGPGGRKRVKADTVPNFTINFNPKGAVTSAGDTNNRATTFSNLNATIDTGAPDFNLQDDANNTIRTLMQNYLTSCPSYSWLSGCKCFKPGYPVEVGFVSNGKKGSYLTEGAAVCNYGEWPFKSEPKRINAGAHFYYHMNQQMYDLNNGKVGFVFP